MTRQQRALLSSIYEDARDDDERRLWTEPAPDDNRRTLDALARQGFIEWRDCGREFRMTAAGIRKMSNGKDETHDEM